MLLTCALAPSPTPTLRIACLSARIFVWVERRHLVRQVAMFLFTLPHPLCRCPFCQNLAKRLACGHLGQRTTSADDWYCSSTCRPIWSLLSGSAVHHRSRRYSMQNKTDVVDNTCKYDAYYNDEFILRSACAVVRCLDLSLSRGRLGFASATCQQHLH